MEEVLAGKIGFSNDKHFNEALERDLDLVTERLIQKSHILKIES